MGLCWEKTLASMVEKRVVSILAYRPQSFQLGDSYNSGPLKHLVSFWFPIHHFENPQAIRRKTAVSMGQGVRQASWLSLLAAPPMGHVVLATMQRNQTQSLSCVMLALSQRRRLGHLDKMAISRPQGKGGETVLPGNMHQGANASLHVHMNRMEARNLAMFLGVDSPFFSTIVLFTNLLFFRGSHGFLERRIPGKNGEVSPRMFNLPHEKHGIPKLNLASSSCPRASSS